MPSFPRTATIHPFSESLDDLRRAPLGGREVAVVYPYPMTLRCETTVRGLPPGIELPLAREARGEGWSVRTRFEQEGSTVRGTLELTLRKRRFEPAEFDELKRFWDAARQAASAALPAS